MRRAGEPLRPEPRPAALALLLLLVAAAGCGEGEPGGREPGAPTPEGPRLSAELAADSAGLGDPVDLTVTAIAPEGSRIDFSVAGDSIGAWRILVADEPQTERRGELLEWRRRFVVAGYRLGAIGPDTLRARAVTRDGDTLRLTYAPDPLRVGGVMKPDEPIDPTKARDIQDVVATGPPTWPWIAAGGALLAAASFLFARWLENRRRSVALVEAPRGPTPEEEFEEAIARLLAEGLLEQGRVREFYYEVSRAVRLFLERVHGLPLLESTSSEALELLSARLRSPDEREKLTDWLTEGDLVKYAKMERLQAEAMNYLERSRALVRVLARPAPQLVALPAAPVPAPGAGPAAPPPGARSGPLPSPGGPTPESRR